MTYEYNYKFWVATQTDIDDIIKRQEVFKRLKPIENKTISHCLFAELYVRYVQLVNKLGYVYHHTFQGQKRNLIKALVEASSQRLLELKGELKNMELSEFIYVDKVLVEKRLTPDDITVWVPKYFPCWRPINIQEMIHGPRKFSNLNNNMALIDQKGKENQTSSNTNKKGIKAAKGRGVSQEICTVDLFKKKIKDVAILIQSHERARVERLLLGNIRRNPTVYKPKMREDGIAVKYKFTYKLNQTMLIPVKRTQFDANYFIQKKDLRSFNYYVKPVHLPSSRLFEDQMSDVEESEEETFFEAETVIGLEKESFGGSECSEFEDNGTAKNMDEYIEHCFNLAAQKIQTYWRAYRSRQLYKSLTEKRKIIYGMSQEFKPKSKENKLYEDRVKEAALHRLIKERYDEELAKFYEDDRARILRIRSPWIMEDISDNIRAWFREFYDKLNCFHPYPEEAKGGTLLLIRGETMDVFEYQSQLNAKELSKDERKKLKDKEKAQKEKIAESAKKEKLAEMKRRAKLKKAGIIDMNDEMQRSKSIAIIDNTINEYKREWTDICEQLNRKEDPIKEWITSENYAKIHEELQLTVEIFPTLEEDRRGKYGFDDYSLRVAYILLLIPSIPFRELGKSFSQICTKFLYQLTDINICIFRLEYELLQRALASDKKTKYKPPKKKKTKTTTKKGKKKKIMKDLTAERSIESLYYELQDMGIITSYPRKTLNDFIGDRNLCAYDLLNIHMKDTPPYKGEIKDILTEYILGMGNLSITKPKSVCLVGPAHSGKKLLCDIFATETDAVVLDISPENTTQYQNNLTYFLHIIVKMAKILQPTILFIREIHRVFWKKVPKNSEGLNPKLLQSYIKKNILKPLKKDDKIIFLATTSAPWMANAKMKKTFQKILLVPKTEYASSFILRRNTSLQTYSTPRDLDFSALALVTRAYATGDLVININETLNLRRRMQLSRRPLHEIEFLDQFLNKEFPQFPPELKEWEKFVKWYRKANKMARQRTKMIKLREAQLTKMEKKKIPQK